MTSTNETQIGQPVADVHGRIITVYRDKSGAIRLDFGLHDRMLTPDQWRQLAELGNLAATRDGDVRQQCETCASTVYAVYYDPTAQGMHAECANCGHVIGGIR